MKKNKVGEVLKFHISIPLWLIISLVAFITVIIYIFLNQYREEIKFIATVVACSTAIFSAYYVGAALRMKIDRDKQQASFEILSLLNRPEFVEVRSFIEDNVESHEKISENELYTKIRGDKELTNAVTVVLGIFEDASIAIQTEYVDEEVLFLSLNHLVLRTHCGLRGYIEQFRKHTNSTNYYNEFEKLVKAWGDNQRLSDGNKISCITTKDT